MNNDVYSKKLRRGVGCKNEKRCIEWCRLCGCKFINFDDWKIERSVFWEVM